MKRGRDRVRARQRRLLRWTLPLLALGLFACQKGKKQGEHADDHHDHEHPVGVERIEVSGVRKSKDDKGRDVLAAGKSMPSAPTAKTATLRAKADTWLGKQVRLRGRVSAQCTKRRRWFAIVDDDSGRTMRVLTVPVFLPPRQVVGKQVEVVGKLERLELPLKRAQHMAEHHKLTPPDKASIKGKRVQELVLRAVSARFFQ